MYIPQGFYKDELGDIDIIAHGDVLHAFYLSIPSHDRIGHLISHDGLRWEEQPPALHTGNPGDFDDDQLWTMGVFAFRNRFFMLYTGLSRAERGKVQRVGLATSDDLFTWTRSDHNPILQADPTWYEAQADASHRVNWRDPWVLEEDGVLHGVMASRSNQGPANRRGAAAYFVSTDGLSWQIKPPICVPGNCFEFETPAICILNQRYYLTGICGREADRASTSIVRVADQIEGPYRRIGRDELLAAENFVFKPCPWRGQTLYFHNLRGTADWDGGGESTVTSLAPPKVAEATPGGELLLRPFRDWSGLSRPADTDKAQELFKSGHTQAGTWNVDNGLLRNEQDAGTALFLMKPTLDSFILEADLEATGPGEFGVLFRATDDGDDATFVSLDPALRQVRLYNLMPQFKTPSAGVTYRWRGRRMIQQWTSPSNWSERLRLRLVAYGLYCEVSVDDRVLISAISMRRHSGRIGFFAEDALLAVGDVSLQQLVNAPAVT